MSIVVFRYSVTHFLLILIFPFALVRKVGVVNELWSSSKLAEFTISSMTRICGGAIFFLVFVEPILTPLGLVEVGGVVVSIYPIPFKSL